MSPKGIEMEKQIVNYYIPKKNNWVSGLFDLIWHGIWSQILQTKNLLTVLILFISRDRYECVCSSQCNVYEGSAVSTVASLGLLAVTTFISIFHSAQFR